MSKLNHFQHGAKIVRPELETAWKYIQALVEHLRTIHALRLNTVAALLLVDIADTLLYQHSK